MNRSEYAANRGLAIAAQSANVTAYTPAARPDIAAARAAVARVRRTRRAAPLAAVASFVAAAAAVVGFGGAQ